MCEKQSFAKAVVILVTAEIVTVGTTFKASFLQFNNRVNNSPAKIGDLIFMTSDDFILVVLATTFSFSASFI